MTCEILQEKTADFLTGDLDEASRKEVQDHIASCPPCREELANLTALWAKLGLLPAEQPSGRLRTGFYSMLEDYKRNHEERERAPRAGRLLAGLRERFSGWKPAYAFASGAVLLLIGIGAGWILHAGRVSPKEVAALRGEVQDLRQAAALSFLDQASASNRLQGISYTELLERPDARTLAALINTLNADPNANVRLAAVDALYLFRNEPGVKDSLVRSLAAQDSPLVQVALIDLLVGIREQRAAEALKTLIGSGKLSPEVKQRAEQGLQQLL